MTNTEKRIAMRCKKFGIDYAWVKYNFGFSRLVIEMNPQDDRWTVRSIFERMKNVKVDSHFFPDGFGRIYVSDRTEWEKWREAENANMERVHNWWRVRHDCLKKGMLPDAASARAEELFPTP